MKANAENLLLVALIGVCILLVGARFVHIGIDPPYGIVSWSGTFLTDEGWWTKNAQLWAKFGVVRNEYDSNLIVDSAAFTMLMAALFKMFSTNIFVARYAAVAASVISLALLYAIARRNASRETALLVVIASAVTLHAVTYARMSILEPFGTCLSIAAIYCLVAQPDRPLNQSLSLAFAGLAIFVKTTFLFTLLTIVAVLLTHSLVQYRSGRIRAALSTAACVACWLSVILVARFMLRHLFPEDAVVSNYAFAQRFEDFSFRTLLEDELRAVTYVATSFHWVALFIVLASSLLWIAVRLPSGQRFSVPLEARVMLLWLVAGTLFFGAFKYQAPRYFYFVSFAAPLVALSFAASLARQSSHKSVALAALCAIVVAQGAFQLPAYRSWYWRGGSASYFDAARAFASTIELDAGTSSSGPIVAMGAISSFVSLFSSRLRPTDFGPIAAFPVAESRALIGRDDDMCTRVAYWRPRYAIGPESKTPKLLETCPHLIHREEEIARRQVMNGWYFNSDLVVRRLTYLSAAPSDRLPSVPQR